MDKRIFIFKFNYQLKLLVALNLITNISYFNKYIYNLVDLAN